MNFITYKQMVDDSISLARKMVGQRFTAVLGIARSGMLPASIVAQELGVHLGSVKSGVIECGGRLSSADIKQMGNRILVVDDSLDEGTAMAEAKRLIPSPLEPVYAVLYVTPGRESHVDHYVRAVPNRIFEWNWFHSPTIKNAYCDMDGVLCSDPVNWDNEKPHYGMELPTLSLMRRPTYTVGTIVTVRMEKWREVTEKWLRDNLVHYDRLVMSSHRDFRERNDYGAGKWKGEVYRDADSTVKLFVESDEGLAREIADISHRPVLCPFVGKMF